MTIISQKVKMVFLSNICVMQHFQKREAFLTCLITDALPWSHVVLQPSRKQDVSIYQDYDRLQSNGVVIVTVSSDEEDNGKQVVLSGVTDIDQGLQPKVEFTCPCIFAKLHVFFIYAIIKKNMRILETEMNRFRIYCGKNILVYTVNWFEIKYKNHLSQNSLSALGANLNHSFLV